MCTTVKLLISLLTVVVAQQRKVTQSSQGSCLLAKKKMMGKVSLVQEESMTFEEMGLMRRDWRIQHSALEKKLNRSQDVLDKFIKAQSESSDHCASRLMESKRVLDGILSDVHTINTQVKSHEAVLETETENLKITKLSITAVETEYENSNKICKEERQYAEEELKKYSAELEELRQIANPSVRADISHSVKVEKSEKPTDDVSDNGRNSLSLVEFHLDKQMCKAFLNFAQRHEHGRLVDGPEKKDCDEQREELQEAFEKAYKETRELKEAARKRTVDETCFDTSETIKASELVPLVSSRDAAVEKIESASQAIAAIEPVLSLVKEKSEKLRSHITQTLTPECEEAGEASKLLVEVRKLIISMEGCPVGNDFKLKIPPVETENSEATTEAPNGQASDEENVEFPEEQSPEKTEEYIKKAKDEENVEFPEEQSPDKTEEYIKKAKDEDPTPTEAPTESPTEAPAEAPTEAPSNNNNNEAPTEAPSNNNNNNEAPTEAPSNNNNNNEAPTEAPSNNNNNNEAPTEAPSNNNSGNNAGNFESMQSGSNQGANVNEKEAEKAGGNEVPEMVAEDMTKEEAEKAGGNEVPADMTEEEAEKAGGNEVPNELAGDMTEEEAEKAGGDEVPMDNGRQ